MTTATRLTRLREKMQENDLQAFLVGCPVEDIFHLSAANRRYISGFTGSTGWALITEEKSFMAVDFRYVEQAQNECPGFHVFRTTGAVDKWFADLAGEAGLAGKRIGFQPGDLSVAGLNAIRKSVDSMPEPDRPKLLSAPALISDLRAIKEPEELDALQRAVDIGDAAFVHAAERLEPGMTEKQVAWEIEKYARENGAEFMSFPTIVAAGPHGAMPHAQPTGYAIQAGDPVVIDMGVIVDGYCSDLTRTIVCANQPDDQFKKVYDIVFAAQLTAEELIRSGMTGDEAHMLAHNVIAEAGFGENFGHGLGHGVGLQIHEAPSVARSATNELLDGMIITVEPGIYISGWGGVRIEDQCLLENGRVRPQSHAPKLSA
ncbi:MAG TPA: aminopeptidase P family protein [Dehalococcoidia bacterium]|nr:aminopeptidase P family protein [Dehalococcoidia bacterium]